MHDLDRCQQTVREAEEKILLFKEIWIPQGTWNKIAERKQMEKIISTRSETVKDRYQTKYQELDKEETRMAKKNKDYVGNLAEKTEEAAKPQNIVCFLKSLRKSSVLKQPASENTALIAEPTQDIDINRESPSIQEWQK